MDFFDDILGEDIEPDERAVCNRCKTPGLHWQSIVKADGTPGHALFTESNRRHTCAGPDDDGFTTEEEMK